MYDPGHLQSFACILAFTIQVDAREEGVFVAFRKLGHHLLDIEHTFHRSTALLTRFFHCCWYLLRSPKCRKALTTKQVHRVYLD